MVGSFFGWKLYEIPAKRAITASDPLFGLNLAEIRVFWPVTAARIWPFFEEKPLF
jgi:hypothetical protein